MKNRITLKEWLFYVDALSEPVTVSVKFPLRQKKNYTSFTDVRRRASPAELEAPISSVLIGKGDDGIVIELIPPKEYSTKAIGRNNA